MVGRIYFVCNRQLLRVQKKSGLGGCELEEVMLINVIFEEGFVIPKRKLGKFRLFCNGKWFVNFETFLEILEKEETAQWHNSPPPHF